MEKNSDDGGGSYLWSAYSDEASFKYFAQVGPCFLLTTQRSSYSYYPTSSRGG